MSRYCVIGGGLSGLSAAFHLRQKLPDAAITVIEASHRYGGWIETHKTSSDNGFEIGPRSVRVASPTSPFLFDICEKLNLAGDLIPVASTAAAAKNRYVYVYGKLHELKPKLFRSSMPFQRPLFPTLVSSLWNDKKLVARIRQEDMSVDEYFRAHFNDELADIAVNAMIRGIYAGDSAQLGMKSVFPQIVRMEEESNGLIRSFMKQMLADQSPPALDSALHRRALNDKWSVWGIKGGMESIIKAMVDYLRRSDVSLLSNSECVETEFQEGQVKCSYRTKTGMKSVSCDHVFLATSAPVCSRLLDKAQRFGDETMSALLHAPYVDVAVVGMEFKDVQLPVQGFGHLIPSWEIPHILGVVYDSCIFASGDGGGEPRAKLTCMMGGAWFKQYCEGMVEIDFLKLALKAVESQLGISGRPCDYHVRINRQCIPQYPVGYQDRIRKARQILSDKQLPVSLIGSTFDGVSVNDCVASAYNAVEYIMRN